MERTWWGEFGGMARRSNQHERERTFPEYRLRKRNTLRVTEIEEGRNEEENTSGPEEWECHALKTEKQWVEHFLCVNDIER